MYNYSSIEMTPVASRDLRNFHIDDALLVPHGAVTSGESQWMRVAIIGGGPAGLSAANILARLGYEVTLFEAMPVLGGMVAVGIPEYRKPKRLVNYVVETLLHPNVDVYLNTSIGKDVPFQLLQHHFDAIILAVGVQQSIPLKISGEEILDGVIPAMRFLKQCYFSPWSRVKGDVAVVGGSMVTIDVARLAMQTGADSVQVFFPGKLSDLPALPEEIHAAQQEGIVFHVKKMPRSILGTEDMNVQGVHCQHTVWSPANEVHDRPFVYVPGTDTWYDVDTVVMAYGERPDVFFLPDQIGLEEKQMGNIWVDEQSSLTSIPHVFAAGEMVGGPRTILHAIAQGARIAHAVHTYCKIGSSLPISINRDATIISASLRSSQNEQSTLK